MSGYCARNVGRTGHSTVCTAYSSAESRIVPAGLLRSALIWARPCRISSIAGPISVSSRSPASVGDTRRVVRWKSGMSMRSSSARMVWLRADCDTPSRLAARVKLSWS